MRANPHDAAGAQQALDPLLPARGVLHDVRARPHAHEFFGALGFDVDDFDRRVLKLTNEICRQVFPVTIDLENPRVWELFDRMLQNTARLAAMATRRRWARSCRRAGLMLGNVCTLARLFVMRATRNERRADVRLEPSGEGRRRAGVAGRALGCGDGRA
jgi:magnesium-protoporphyrin IX monomethyl ester (oxidative) cyclase